MFQSLFNEVKAAEVVAYLLDKSNGSMEILKLMKLTYLVERRSYELYGDPIIGDIPYSFEHGPVLSRVFDLAKVEGAVNSKTWSHWITPAFDKNVSLVAHGSFSTDDLLNLSDSDIQILASIWEEYGHMTGVELRAFTHKLPEYEEQKPGKRSLINQVKMLRAIGLTDKQAHKRIGSLRAHNRAKAAFTHPA